MTGDDNKPLSPWRHGLHTIIFEADTPLGKLFDIGLLISIGISIVAVCLESVADIEAKHGDMLRAVEWSLTVAFTLEYLLRLICVGRPWRYATSFFGVVDFLAILPTYLSLVFTGTQSLIVIRALRLLRIFRILKLGQFLGEAAMLRAALRASARKIIVFLGTVLTVVLIVGALMYLIEADESGFTSIPQSMYWAIVTLTTVGYGDVAPATVMGKFLASLVMILGYAIIAVPTGIVSVELANVAKMPAAVSTQACEQCAKEGHDIDAKHCKHCGATL